MGPTLSLPTLANWQDFERLCRDLWKRIWQVPHAFLNGRGGQAQHGVDVWAPLEDGARFAGVQCKRFEETFKSKSQIEAEVDKARKFNPALCDFVIATTAPNDGKAQEWAREITAAQLKIGSFPVTIYGWGDICRELAPHTDLIRLYFPDFSWSETLATRAPESLLDTVRRAYLADLFSQLERMTLGVFGKSSQRVETRLHEIFVSLDIEKLVGLAGAKDRERSTAEPVDELARSLRPRLVAEEKALVKLKQIDRSREDPYARPVAALEALAIFPRLVLTGKAGSGKSTFGRFVALCLAGEQLGRAEADLALLNRDRARAAGAALEPQHRAWRHGAALPFWVELSRFVRSEAFPPEVEEGGSKHLFEYLVGTQQGGELRALLGVVLDQENGTLVVLDGLDETPAAESVRTRLLQVIDGFVRAWPRCRILVTSRPYAYDQDKWRLDGFASERLAGFDETKRAAFVRAWTAHLAQHGEIEAQTIESRSKGLIRAIESAPYLRALADTPLMLTMIADLDTAHGGRLPPGGRARLYEESVMLLLDRWNQVRHGANVAESLGIDVIKLRQALEQLAFEIHKSRGHESEGAVLISETELWQAVKPLRPCDGKFDEQEVRNYLHQRSGILIAESPEVFCFPHRSYQEYLASCFLTKAVQFPHELVKFVQTEPTLWREVFQLAIGRSAETPFMAWAALEALVPETPLAELDDKRRVVLANGFAIGRYLATNAQFRAFVDDGGYSDRWRSCWTAEGRAWLSENKVAGPDDDLAADFLLANHPRVNVNFFEAWAFCRWLGEKLGCELVVPTEHQWERAARSVDGREYPWGDEPDPTKMNIDATGIGQPSAVGMFPNGASVEGVLDIAGNVWEWTASPWAEPNDSFAEQAADLAAAPVARRVLRGGSFWDTAGRARSAYRNHWNPGLRWLDLGFRVLLPRPPARRSSVDL